MSRKSSLIIVLISVLAGSWASAFQQGKKGEDANVRSVQGVVEDPQQTPVEGAVVQLKNTKSLQVRSFITQREGTYYFHGLSPDVEYELKAEFRERIQSAPKAYGLRFTQEGHRQPETGTKQ